MPSRSPAQARLMAAAAHTPGGFGGVPQSVGRDFNQADKGSKLLRRANSKRGYADGGLATEVSGSEFQPAIDNPQSIADAPAVRRAMMPSQTTQSSESQRRTLGRLATGIRG